MATAIRVELLTMWDEGRREAVRRIRGRLFEAAWRAEDGREWLDPKVTSTILDDVDRVAGLNASESPPLRPDFCVSCEGQHDEGKHSRDASESPPTATCCGHLPHGNGPCHGMVTDWGGERIPCDCDGRDASESPRTEWRDPEGPPEPPKIVGNASESPPTLSNSGGSVTNVPSPEFHDGVRATLPTGQRHYHGDTLYDRAIECYDVHGDASESPPVHVCCEGQPRVGDASESGQPPEADR